MALSEISQLLALAVGMDGELAHGYTEEDIEALKYRLFYEFGSTEVGLELYERGGKGIVQRVEKIYNERNDGRPYCVVDALGELESIGRDLLVDLPEPVEPKSIPQPAQTLTPGEEHAKLVQQVRNDIANPTITAASINARRRANPKYEAAFREANTPQAEKKAVPVVDGKVVQFSHLYNEAVQSRGINSVRPRMGIVTLTLNNGKQYVYPHAEFTQLLEAAAQSNLI
jgi:hypothetical protein